MPRTNPNLLLVEGEEDKRVIPFFMEHFIAWGNERSSWPVEIMAFNGIEDLLTPGTIEVSLKTSGLKALGVVADANDKLANRWKRIRERALSSFPLLPEDLPEDGLISQNVDGLRFGTWLMPDNKSRGMLETFLSLFIPAQGTTLWDFVQNMCSEAARNHQAPFQAVHIDKVQIHAWLALQDPPGQQLHLAVLTKTLKPESPRADGFVNWFRTLYGL